MCRARWEDSKGAYTCATSQRGDPQRLHVGKEKEGEAPTPFGGRPPHQSGGPPARLVVMSLKYGSSKGPLTTPSNTVPASAPP
mmetsp:Transcript_74170/g.144926  ORF Transcript_74170/g.144926 Transcript_74170/m.144926 type:complete len:83 (+) Transcript_74170:248-496(+)